MAQSRDSSYKSDDFIFSGCRRWGAGCLLILFLLVSMVCLGLTLLTSIRSAKAATPPLTIWLLIDNSNSMFEKDGQGTDPDLLRLDAARLFLSYLGVDEPEASHEAGVIFFGSEAETAVPLTPLTSSKQRKTLFSRIANPERMGWTDHLAALQLAQTQLAEHAKDAHLVIIMLTDGRPEWSETTTQAARDTYLADLRGLGQELAEQNTTLYVIQLANDITDEDEEIETIWQPLWQELSAATPQGIFFEARTAMDLPDIYHNIVVALTNRASVGAVLDTAVSDHTAYPLEIPPHLDQITLVIRKASPTQTVTLQTNTGQQITTNHPQLRRAGDENTWEEVWVIDHPIPGTWMAEFSQSGPTTIWLDYIPAVATTSTPTPTTIIYPTATNQELLPVTATMKAPATPAKVAALLTSAPPTSGSNKTLPQSNGLRLVLGWVILIMAAVLVTTVYLYRRYQQPQPMVTGTLKLLHGLQTDTGQIAVDLETLNRMVITIGKTPADIPLAGAMGQVILRPGAAIGDVHEMLISGIGEVQLNKVAIFHETTLTDTAVIDLGNGIQVRYENLRLRRALQESLTPTGKLEF